jgi:hypothetical protein
MNPYLRMFTRLALPLLACAAQVLVDFQVAAPLNDKTCEITLPEYVFGLRLGTYRHTFNASH